MSDDNDAAHSVAVERERCLSLLRVALASTQPGARETNADRWWSQRIRDVLRAIETGDENQTAAELIRRERERHAAELDELHALVARQAAILTGVANALRGPPGPLASHSHHDLAERAARVVRERDRASALNDEDATMIRELFAAVAERERWCDERDATIARLTSAVREYLAAEASHDAASRASMLVVGDYNGPEVEAAGDRIVAASNAQNAARAALAALVGGAVECERGGGAG